jgi:translation initiation factor IF-3
MAKQRSKNEIKKPRINEELYGLREVRLIYKEHKEGKSDKDFNKIVSMYEARGLAKEYQLDLIEINGNMTPPIVRLDDYSKYLYNLKKLQKQSKKKTTTLKEIQLKANISMHDLEIKVKKAKEFLKEGDKVKVVLTLKGRELSRREESKKCFYEFIEMVTETGHAAFDCPPRDEETKSYVIFKKK